MSFEERQDFAKQVADLNRYGQALNQCQTVEEVGSMTLEAVSLLLELTEVTVFEVRDSDLVVRASTADGHAEDSDHVVGAREAVASGETVSSPAGDDSPATLAIPAGIVDDVVTVIVVQSSSVVEFSDEYVRPLEILGSHAATAMSNIRSRQRLERARQDLETRKEMVEMYDRLLRHDIGNDLQVISGFADVLATQLDDGQSAEYAQKIERAALNSADLIDRVGELVSTLESQDEPDARELRPVLAETVRDVASQYESLTVEFDPEAFDYRVFAGDLLDSVFRNVISNAAVHNEGPVTVVISVEEPTPDTVVVVLADDGAGIPEQVRDELFEMGAKGPDSDGTGFGLGFVRALTESYGGSVAVGESPEGGAAFRVTLDQA